jgi:hypothetical protein
MNFDDWFVPAFIERHDDLRHVRKLIAAGKADYAAAVAAAWS